MALFTGAVTLGAAAAVTFVGTSAPILGKSVQVDFYNEMNLPLAILIALLNGFSLILKWKETKGQEIFKKSLFALISAIALTIILILFGMHHLTMILFAFASAFAFFVNAEIAYKVFRGNIRMAGAYVAHMGLALLFLGVIASAKYDTTIDVDLIKNNPVDALGYKLTFTGYHPTKDGKYAFNVDIEKDGKKYSVAPIMFYSDFNQGLMRNPDILQTLTKDFYISPISYDDGSESAQSGTTHQIKKGESVKSGESEIKFIDFDFDETSRNNMMAGGEITIGAKLEIKNYGKTFTATPKYTIRDEQRIDTPAEIKEANLSIRLISLSADNGSITISASPFGSSPNSNTVRQEILAVSASIKPFINLVWGGTIIMVIGFIISIVRRSRESRS